MSQSIMVRELTALEQKALSRLIRSSGDARLVRRAQMVRMAQQGRTVSEIAAVWEVTAETVRRALARFNAGGIALLAEGPPSARPGRATEHYVALWDPPW